MWDVPKAISIVAGAGEGLTEVNAFDRALLEAGVANLNFIRVTSIFPAGAKIVPPRQVPAGALVPAVYTRVVSDRPGDVIAAAVGVGLSRGDFGVIMEYHVHAPAAAAEARVRAMVEEAFAIREMALDQIHVRVAEHAVRRCGCAVAAVLFWPE
ncbi:MAG: arginine decarboxylase, pyruvoyl-dependent [Armatimonadetes bacterium]|nr:arginine decarboxylase, pyruvoyl-dependent [Armatimonadota bacterium]